MKTGILKIGHGALAGVCLLILSGQSLHAQQDIEEPPAVAQEQVAGSVVAKPAAATGSTDDAQGGEKRRRITAEVDFDTGQSWHGAIVPVVGVLTVFGLPTLITIMALYFAYRRSKMRHETLLALAERGVDISNLDLLEPNEKKDTSPINDLRTGLVLLGAGLGISVMLIVLGIEHIAGVGAIPGLIGLAYICIYAVRRKSASAE